MCTTTSRSNCTRFKLVVVVIDVNPVVIVKMLPDIMPSPLLSAREG